MDIFVSQIAPNMDKSLARGQITSFSAFKRLPNSHMTGLIIDDDPLIVQTIGFFADKSDLVETYHHATGWDFSCKFA